ncbi:Di-n-acetylchitobiase [Plakobranchus ocellatus]|uniref:Di-n-acetylchitobiase n=1 Tax=Plakobranchus ocellatus TaxID=259542 RepID=A0AAV4CT44_9GAST|nr:Di-n-acetylchitobiase [Plakobranchus ocellatus]
MYGGNFLQENPATEFYTPFSHQFGQQFCQQIRVVVSCDYFPMYQTLFNLVIQFTPTSRFNLSALDFLLSRGVAVNQRNKVLPETMQRLAFLFLFLFLWSAVAYKCPCENENDCKHPVDDRGTVTEVFAFSNGTTDVHVWSWSTLTTLVAPSNFSVEDKAQANTMCVAHSKGRKFSITVAMGVESPLNATSPDADSWVESVLKIFGQWYADVLTVDLLHYFSHDTSSTESDHKALVKILMRVKSEVEEMPDIPFKMACIVPWKPPCAETDASCYFSSLSNDVCDYFIINTDSFIDHDDSLCTARATIPITKLLYGISEYNVHHVPRGKMVLGIPWHGYDYQCATLINGICRLERDEKTNKCDFSQRNPVASSYISSHHGINFDSHTQKDLYWAPNYTYVVQENSMHHQVWFEDRYSLSIKYQLVKDLGVKGIAIMFGDDLSTDKTTHTLINNAIMWSWVSHEFFLSSASQTRRHENLHYADSVAGVAVGCLLLGTALGTLLTCLALRSRIRKPKQSFLTQPDDSQVDDFHDEEDGRL